MISSFCFRRPQTALYSPSLVCHLSPSSNTRGMDEHCDVLILGAGAAGIGAARRLLEEGGEDETNENWKMVVLEARDRVGGRAWTSDELECGTGLDHGGKWIHGGGSRAPDGALLNPMTALAARYEVPTTARKDGNTPEFRRRKRRSEDIKRVVIGSGRSGDGAAQSVAPSRQAENASKMLYKQLCESGRDSLIAPLKHSLPLESTFKDCLVKIAKEEMPGKPVAEWLEERVKKTLIAAGNPIKMVTQQLIAETIALLRYRVYWLLENYEGCRLDQCSLRHTYSGTILPGKNVDVAGGYGMLLQTAATTLPIDIRCGHRVLSIDRSSSSERGVVVVCAAKEGGSVSEKRFIARLGCIVALPLGVLQPIASNPGVRDPAFVPPLPEALMGAFDRLGMCLMDKIEILFPSRWWPNGTGSLTIATESRIADDFPFGDMPWAHWIVEEDDPPILVCYATGAFAERIETMADEAIEWEGVEALRLAFLGDRSGKGSNITRIASIPDPVKTHVTRWRSDPFARGSWTFFKAGTRGIKDVLSFQKFNKEQGGEERLFFAGEHTCDGSVDGLDIGTVHGAYLSGTLAANELLVQNRKNVANT